MNRLTIAFSGAALALTACTSQDAADNGAENLAAATENAAAAAENLAEATENAAATLGEKPADAGPAPIEDGIVPIEAPAMDDGGTPPVESAAPAAAVGKPQ